MGTQSRLRRLLIVPSFEVSRHVFEWSKCMCYSSDILNLAAMETLLLQHTRSESEASTVRSTGLRPLTCAYFFLFFNGFLHSPARSYVVILGL